MNLLFGINNVYRNKTNKGLMIYFLSSATHFVSIVIECIKYATYTTVLLVETQCSRNIFIKIEDVQKKRLVHVKYNYAPSSLGPALTSMLSSNLQ